MRETNIHRHARAGFSLAELMIAIAIFGVGMLMVAATFPVGLDQCRIVAEQTMAPIVANEAFAMLEMFLNSNSVLSGGKTLRQAIEDKGNINEWLKGVTGIRLGVYPSLPSTTNEPAYYWNTLAAILSSSAGQVVKFVVFVNRRTATIPGPDEVHLNPQHALYLVEDQNKLTEGMIICSDIRGQIYRINTVNHAPGQIFIDLEPNLSSDDLIPATDGNSEFPFWYVPADSNTGRSPCIAVYSRTYPL